MNPAPATLVPSILVHLAGAPARLYLAPLLERLQEEDQPPELHACLNGLKKIAYRGYPATSAEVVRLHARLKFSLYLLADLRPRNVLKPEG